MLPVMLAVTRQVGYPLPSGASLVLQRASLGVQGASRYLASQVKDTCILSNAL